ncbi:AraC family transcriptional regulator [Pedobacter sp. MC2016-05]|uniref:helix-turn-helix transcriptional regulator n=1 Tax=Pedobacter sp. MC2016-05 TaxID=2994474 RepID=UPI00224691DD|nr:AraC family transcriptional regulator [Pedobacter sp. MC2016-05]MCX2474019.1 AraC family transcriptional regulator [Pedobacter sp. MC2016-05]
MHEVREILIQQSGDQLSLRALAHLVGTNEFNLKRDFKALFGKTVFAYLNQHKMEKAKNMLIEEDTTVSEISKRMGYKHATHFTSAFKKYFGYLPNKIKTGKLSLLIFFEDFIALLENLSLLTI